MGWLAAVLAAAGLAALSGGSCGKKDDESSSTDIQETGQQVGDVMASIDESGGGSGSYALLEDSARRTYARLAPGELRAPWSLVPEAQAATCGISTFSGCVSNVNTRTFGGCTIGAATFNGTVTLTFSDAATDNTCLLTANGHSITRDPNFTVTGRRGATLTVAKTGTNGQKIERASAGVFSFTNDGIRRYFTTGGGSTLFDFTTQTTSAITVTGASRSGRTLSGGTLRVTNNLTNTSCDFVPSSVTWDATCNCPTSGSWSATCSDGKSATLSITGCGTATLTMGSESEDFTFDRCVGV
jgi:hypothetical protein